MSYLFSCQGLAKAFGAQTLFTDISLVINSGDRVGLIGPNGSGKSTLLKIICDREQEDSGTIMRRRQCTISYLAQEDVFDESSSPVDNLLNALEALPFEQAE
ncbi:MAG: ATP-binding cassette domain-containing protein, partial [Desulfocapsaceae bacterium]|nr:ATP-binding cassette domain-containing protein [Desulfocapsaceae bacterium]